MGFRNLLRPVTIVFIGLLGLQVHGSTGEPDDLFGLLNQRLALMQQVAAYKWQHRLPIEHPERERQVLAAATDDALRHGLTPDSARSLFVAQMEAAKVVQRYWFEAWTTGPGPGPAPDLNQVIRPRLLELGERILAAAAVSQTVGRDAFDAALQVEGLDAQSRSDLYHAVAGLQHFPNRLVQVLVSGVLRVGTTGDYAPFTLQRKADAAPAGIDVDLARDLGEALDAEVRFVATTWPTLMRDLAAGRFDVAMGGVSRTLERQREGFFSGPYYVGGKTPIVRCADAGRFPDLAAIDRPGVRVIVNPGGTNERFVDANIRQADRIAHEDNRTIFQALVDGRADVMITDRIEVELQARQHPELCASMPDRTLTYQEKAYLLPQDPVWREFVDTWLHLALADGTVQAAFERHGVAARPPGG